MHDDLLADDVRDDPHPYFRALRERDPVHWNERHRAWILTRYDDVFDAFRDLRFSSERLSTQLPANVADNLGRAVEGKRPQAELAVTCLVAAGHLLL